MHPGFRSLHSYPDLVLGLSLKNVHLLTLEEGSLRLRLLCSPHPGLNQRAFIGISEP